MQHENVSYFKEKEKRNLWRDPLLFWFPPRISTCAYSWQSILMGTLRSLLSWDVCPGGSVAPSLPMHPTLQPRGRAAADLPAQEQKGEDPVLLSPTQADCSGWPEPCWELQKLLGFNNSRSQTNGIFSPLFECKSSVWPNIDICDFHFLHAEESSASYPVNWGRV